MSDVSIYDISVGTYIEGLTVLVNILKKAAMQPDADTLPSASLIEDMLPLSFQVQSVSNTVSGSLKRLLKTDIQSWEDNETTMEQLVERAENTLALLKGMDPKTLEGGRKERLQSGRGRDDGQAIHPQFRDAQPLLPPADRVCHSSHERCSAGQG